MLTQVKRLIRAGSRREEQPLLTQTADRVFLLQVPASYRKSHAKLVRKITAAAGSDSEKVLIFNVTAGAGLSGGHLAPGARSSRDGGRVFLLQVPASYRKSHAKLVRKITAAAGSDSEKVLILNVTAGTGLSDGHFVPGGASKTDFDVDQRQILTGASGRRAKGRGSEAMLTQVKRLIRAGSRREEQPLLTQTADRVFLLQVPASYRKSHAKLVRKITAAAGSDSEKVLIFNVTAGVGLSDGHFVPGGASQIDFDVDQKVTDFQFLLSLCVQIHGWLCTSDDAKVVILTNTGERDPAALLAACYLMATNPRFFHGKTTLEYLSHHSSITTDLPSYERYAVWFGFLLAMQGVPSSDRLDLRKITIRKAKALQAENYALIVTDSKGQPLSHTTDTRAFRKDGSIVVHPKRCDILGDFEVLYVVYHTSTDPPWKEVVFRFAFSTLFLCQAQMKINKRDLDVAAANPHLPKDFHVILEFAGVEPLAAREVVSSPEQSMDGSFSQNGASFTSPGTDGSNGRAIADMSERDRTFVNDITHLITRTPRVASNYDLANYDDEFSSDSDDEADADELLLTDFEYACRKAEETPALKRLVQSVKERNGEAVDTAFQAEEVRFHDRK
ncbi:formin-like protein, partial [Diplonema papillatum]